MISCLNALARGQVRDLNEATDTVSPRLKQKLIVAQSKLRCYVTRSCDREFRHGLLLRADRVVKQGVEGHCGQYRDEGNRLTLIARNVSLPNDGVAGTVEMLSVLPKSLAEMYPSPELVLIAPDEVDH